MDLRQLEYFREIADTGSINETARRLGGAGKPPCASLRHMDAFGSAA